MNVLVTGSTGNVGTSVVRELLKFHDKVTAAATEQSKIKDRFGDAVKGARLDFTNPETFRDVLDGVDRVFLMRPPHLGKPQDLYPFIDAMQKSGIRLVCFLSLMGIENNPIPPHYKIERHIEKVGLPYCHIRPGFFMQNLSGIHLDEIRDRNSLFIPAGRSRTSFIDASDIGLAAATVLHQPEDHQNTAYTITGPEALSYDQVAWALSDALDRYITYANPGFLKYRDYYIKVRKLDKKLVDVTLALYFMTRLGTAERVTDDFQRLTGREPKKIGQFIDENIEYFNPVKEALSHKVQQGFSAV